MVRQVKVVSDLHVRYVCQVVRQNWGRLDKDGIVGRVLHEHRGEPLNRQDLGEAVVEAQRLGLIHYREIPGKINQGTSAYFSR